VRTCAGVALVTVCLGLAGCSLFGKKSSAQAKNSKPFLGSEAPAKADTTALLGASTGPLPGANGLLAGRVVMQSTGRPVQAVIQVTNLEADEKDKEATIDVWTDQSGYFTIPGLKVGGQYKLIARAKDGGELMSRMVFEKPPKAALYIEIDKQYTTKNTPALPDGPKSLEKKDATADGSSGGASAVSIDPPRRNPDTEGPPGVRVNPPPPPDNGGGTSSSGGPPPNPANVADNGFQRLQPPVAPADIPGPGHSPRQPSIPPVPGNAQWDSAPNDRQPRATPASPPPPPPGSVQLPSMPPKVPSCVLVGGRLVNFALYDIDGNVWEYQRQKRGRLMLLDFWHSQCQYCLRGMHHLVDLQRDYGAYGLQVVGIACETGSEEQQRTVVRSIRGRYFINYPILLSGETSHQPSPIRSQFQADYFPLLVLIDENGTILWRSTRQGMEGRYEELRRMINNRLIAQPPPP
jgi:thiol-disulfide isomerase/thioredoxin